jgi:hypothetical protein
MVGSMAKTVQLTFDARDPLTLVEWWAELLGYQVEDNSEFVASLLEKGVLTEEQVVRRGERLDFADAAAAVDPDGNGPRLYVQRVPEPKTAKNRLHLDVRTGTDDLDAEKERVTARGASFVEWGNQGGHRWAVMRDPEGNEFCLT